MVLARYASRIYNSIMAITQQQAPAIEWRAMAGMRDRLIHNYFGVDYDIVWNRGAD